MDAGITDTTEILVVGIGVSKIDRDPLLLLRGMAWVLEGCGITPLYRGGERSGWGRRRVGWCIEI